MPNTTVALIGYGYWGPNLLRNYMDLPNVDVKWVCDSRPERLEKATARYPAVGTTTDVGEVLDDPAVDAVLIATPIGTHYSLAIEALEAGKHVFV
jgi:predicted dehydrogenase